MRLRVSGCLLFGGFLLGAALSSAAVRRFLATEAPSDFERTAVYGGLRERVEGVFPGGRLRAVFGGIDLDLRGARLPAGGADVQVLSLVGGVRLLVPPEWRTTLEGTPVLGGIQDASQPGPGPDLRVRALAVLGGISIENEK